MEKITLRVFWTCMLLCASCFLVGIWLEGTLPEAYFKIPATFFIVGFASFLLWAPSFMYRVWGK